MRFINITNTINVIHFGTKFNMILERNFGVLCFVMVLIHVPTTCSNTVRVNTQDCFGLPESPITVSGAVISSGSGLGRILCYFSPGEAQQYFAILLTELNLPKQFGSCPELLLHEYSSVRDELIDDTDPNLRVAMTVPSDPKLLLKANCSNYESMRLKSISTSAPGLKLQLLFNPFNSDAVDLSYGLTLTSYVVGPSFNCPTGTYRCWSDRSRCIPESLTCDGVNNCFDDSDENNYLCTGRINGIPIPLFAIIIVVSFLALVLIVTTVVFILRKRKTKVEKEEQTWVDMNIRRPLPTAGDPLLAETRRFPPS